MSQGDWLVWAWIVAFALIIGAGFYAVAGLLSRP